MLIIFELTGAYTIILPLMFAVVLATGISALATQDTIYTLKLRRRGIDVRRGRSVNLMEILTVRDAMQPLPPPVATSTPLNELIRRLVTAADDALPVVDEEGRYRGAVLEREVEQAVQANTLDATAGSLARATPLLVADQTLEQALTILRERSAAACRSLRIPAARLSGG